MPTYNIIIKSKDKEMKPALRKVAKQVTTRGKGLVRAKFRELTPDEYSLSFTYELLGSSIFKRVVLGQVQKAIHKKDKNAQVILIGHKPIKEKIKGLFKRKKGTD